MKKTTQEIPFCTDPETLVSTGTDSTRGSETDSATVGTRFIFEPVPA